jgi:hypothetical protein
MYIYVNKSINSPSPVTATDATPETGSGIVDWVRRGE